MKPCRERPWSFRLGKKAMQKKEKGNGEEYKLSFLSHIFLLSTYYGFVGGRAVMKKRRPKLCVYAILFAVATLAAFIVPVWLIAVMEALIILFFGWMLFFGC